MAISDLLDAGSNRMANEQVKHATTTFHLSIFYLVFLVKQVINLNVATKTDMKSEDFMMFLIKFLITLTGLNTQTLVNMERVLSLTLQVIACA